jgi:hypothetical protein
LLKEGGEFTSSTGLANELNPGTAAITRQFAVLQHDGKRFTGKIRSQRFQCELKLAFATFRLPLA